MLVFLIEEGQDALKLGDDRSRAFVDYDGSGELKHPLFDPSGQDPKAWQAQLVSSLNVVDAFPNHDCSCGPAQLLQGHHKEFSIRFVGRNIHVRHHGIDCGSAAELLQILLDVRLLSG